MRKIFQYVYGGGGGGGAVNIRGIGKILKRCVCGGGGGEGVLFQC